MKSRRFVVLGGIFALVLLLLLSAEKVQKPKETPNLTQHQLQTEVKAQPQQTQTEVKPESSKPLSNKTPAVVSRVIDGDTIVIVSGEKVRLIGINTPEKGRPYFEEAKDKLAEVVEGKTVELEKDISERDRYGRLLRYIWLDGACVNLEMVRQGFAFSYTYPPDVKYQDKILAAQKQAREKQIGLWAPTNGKGEGKGPYVASRSAEVFHYPSCPWAKKISEKNREYFPTRQEAINAGYRPCHVCNP